MKTWQLLILFGINWSLCKLIVFNRKCLPVLQTVGFYKPVVCDFELQQFFMQLSSLTETLVSVQESMRFAGINLQLVHSNIRAWYLLIIHCVLLCRCKSKCGSPWKQPAGSTRRCWFQRSPSLLPVQAPQSSTPRRNIRTAERHILVSTLVLCWLKHKMTRS